jgi:UDP-glucose 4-epimerase
VRVLVTGGAGFIGSNLVDALLAAGHEVTAVDDLSTGRRTNLESAAAAGPDRFSFVQLDVTSPELAGLVAEHRPEVICHLAAQIDVRISVADPLLDARLNVLGTVTVLEAARLAGVRKIVFTSSGGSIYGTPSSLPVDESAPVAPESPYAAGKAAGELYLGAWRAMYGLQTTALALGNVYGPRQDPHGEAGVVAIFSSALLQGRSTTIFGDGTSSRDYVYVGDVCEAFVRACGEPGDGRRFNIGTGVATTVRELHTVVAGAAGGSDEPVFGDPRVGELQAISLDTAAARRELGWAPAVDLADGITRTVNSIRATLAPS